ncbi:hypothetical protein ACVMB2_007036 [Sinorhizobium meliloti]
MTSRYPRDPDSTIRILKAFYKMGDLNAMKHYIDLWDLRAAEKTSDHEIEARHLEDLIAEMEAFETNNGRGSCLQLEHSSVLALMAKSHYPHDVLVNANEADWNPTAYPGWEYPRFRTRNSDTSSKESWVAESVATSR